MTYILTRELAMSDIPNADAPLKKINEFARTFSLGEVGNEVEEISLDSRFDDLSIKQLRYILYYEQRRWNHFGRDYDTETELRIRLLLREIKIKLQRITGHNA
jgi:hypothetical protein